MPKQSNFFNIGFGFTTRVFNFKRRVLIFDRHKNIPFWYVRTYMNACRLAKGNESYIIWSFTFENWSYLWYQRKNLNSTLKPKKHSFMFEDKYTDDVPHSKTICPDDSKEKLRSFIFLAHTCRKSEHSNKTLRWKVNNNYLRTKL